MAANNEFHTLQQFVIEPPESSPLLKGGEGYLEVDWSVVRQFACSFNGSVSYKFSRVLGQNVVVQSCFGSILSLLLVKHESSTMWVSFSPNVSKIVVGHTGQ